MLGPDAITPIAVRALVRRLLDEPRYRSAAWALQAELDDMPPANEVAADVALV